MKISKDKFKIAYFSMEVELENSIKTYSGGLGILAGDILRSAADLKLPIVGITLLNNQGYFEQKINKAGEQEESVVSDYDFSNLKKVDLPVKDSLFERTSFVPIYANSRLNFYSCWTNIFLLFQRKL